MYFNLPEIKDYINNLNYKSSIKDIELDLYKQFHSNGICVAIGMILLNKNGDFFDYKEIKNIIKENLKMFKKEEKLELLEQLKSNEEILQFFIDDGINGISQLLDIEKTSFAEKLFNFNKDNLLSELIDNNIFPTKVHADLILSEKNKDVLLDNVNLNKKFHFFNLNDYIEFPEKKDVNIPVQLVFTKDKINILFPKKEEAVKSIIDVSPARIVKGIVTGDVIEIAEVVSLNEEFNHYYNVLKEIKKNISTRKSLESFFKEYHSKNNIDINFDTFINNIKENPSFSISKKEISSYNKLLNVGVQKEIAQFILFFETHEKEINFLVRGIIKAQKFLENYKNKVVSLINDKVEESAKDKFQVFIEKADKIEHLVEEGVFPLSVSEEILLKTQYMLENASVKDFKKADHVLEKICSQYSLNLN